MDPQGQANNFIKRMGRDPAFSQQGLDTTKLSDKNFLRCLENGVRFGKWVLLENIQETLDAALEPLLLQQKFVQGGTEMIKIGDSVIPYNDTFRFFMTTKLPNPHYPPEVCVKVSLINFTITPVGLEDQMLGVMVVEELPEMEEKKNALVVSNARMKKQLQELEDKILYMLSHSTGNILDDHALIETLASSKMTSDEITIKMQESSIVEAEIDTTREAYRPVAFRGSTLYFCIANLCIVDPMYQYSLQWFTSLFVYSINNSEKSEDVSERLSVLKEYFTYYLYSNICRSLFEKDKLLFSFNMAVKIMQADGLVDSTEWMCLLSGKVSHPLTAPENPCPDWMDVRMWNEVLGFSSLPIFDGFADSFVRDVTAWRAIFDHPEPQWAEMPGGWTQKLNSLQRILVLRAMRPDKVTIAVQDYVTEAEGKRFIEPPPFNLAACYADSTPIVPLLFVLVQGSDPSKEFYSFAHTCKMDRKLKGLSLGQGQGPIALKMIEEGKSGGMWVYLQNCHLYCSWMTTLELQVEMLDPNTVHKDFRLWLTSMPSAFFPVAVLQNGVKMTNEPPKGLRANMKNAYFKLDDEKLSITTKPVEYRMLLFSLCLFHASVQERRKYGPLGWNIPYQFNDTDLTISKSQLEMFIDQYAETPYRVLIFLTSYINYGGRVTDYIDLRTIDVIMKQFYNPGVTTPGHKFCAGDLYYVITSDPEHPHKSYMDYIDGLPTNAGPEVFGMHSNANLTSAMAESFEIFETVLSLEASAGSSGGDSFDTVVGHAAHGIEDKLPGLFNLMEIMMQYPIMYNESMNTVLGQECIRYNKLLTEMHSTLPALQKAIKGLVVMSSQLEAMGNSIYVNKVPDAWAAKAYPSLKPCTSWVAELYERLEFVQKWIDCGIPEVFWISGFYFPQAFLTGSLQNYARKHQLPIDTIDFNYLMMKVNWQDITERPEDGVYIRGLYVEGARWDADKQSLDDSYLKQLYTELCSIHLSPMQNRPETTSGIYRCPVYKELSRRGTLSTTGHSTNFVMWLEIPSDRVDCLNSENQTDQEDWIRAGVAAFCSLKF
jgi:dynein heavy chain